MNIPGQSKRPLLALTISLEGAMAAFSLYSLGNGLMEGQVLQIFWGVMILAGLCLLIAVRRRDWKKHWEEIEIESLERLRAMAPEYPANRKKD